MASKDFQYDVLETITYPEIAIQYYKFPDFFMSAQFMICFQVNNRTL